MNKKKIHNVCKICLESLIPFFLMLVFVIAVCIIQKGKNPQYFLTETDIIEQPIESLLHVQEQLGMKKPTDEEAANDKAEGEEKIPKASLVEQISNPRLGKYPWTTQGLIEEPYQSYAQTKQIELTEFKFVPWDNLTPEAAAEWGEEILYQLVLEPQVVKGYGAVLTASSVGAWENFQWIYANPKDYYRSIFTEFYSQYAMETEYYEFYTYVRIPQDYFKVEKKEDYNSLDRTYADGVDRELIEYLFESYGYSLGEDYSGCDIGIAIQWKYEQSSGLIQVEKMEYQLL